MRTCRNIKTAIILLAMTTWGCGMAEVKVTQPKPLGGMKEVAASGDTRKLDAEVTKFLRDKFAIVSARYYQASAEAPWISISKSVNNQMADKSIRQTMFAWYEPGLDFIEVYPQGKDGGGFALAMPAGTDPNGEKLIGFYVLGPPSAKK